MAAAVVKSLLVSNVPRLDYVSPLPLEPPNFQLIGHRGNGMNSQSYSSKIGAMKENSILSFNQAGRFPINLVEFDVQVTRDDHAVIFHDITILTDGDNGLSEHRVTDLSLEEFLSYGPQKATGHPGKPLLRRGYDGGISHWAVDANADDSLCTLQEAFERVHPHLGFNIELKFDDEFNYREEELAHALSIIWSVVSIHAGDRHVVFSSFHPDAVRIINETQSSYPVLFLTEDGIEMYSDPRRNSMDAAIELCSAYGLQGIVSDVRGVFRDPSVIGRIKEAGLKCWNGCGGSLDARCAQRGEGEIEKGEEIGGGEERGRPEEIGGNWSRATDVGKAVQELLTAASWTSPRCISDWSEIISDSPRRAVRLAFESEMVSRGTQQTAFARPSPVPAYRVYTVRLF